MPFNILEYIPTEYLVKESPRQRIYQCPICGGTNLKVSMTDAKLGAYKCFDGCEVSAIRNKLSPPQNPNSLDNQNTPPRRAKVIEKKVIAKIKRPSELKLTKLDLPYRVVTDTTEEYHPVHGKCVGTVYYYSDSQYVVRRQWIDTSKPKGYDKDFSIWHVNYDNRRKEINNAGPGIWKAYRLDEAVKAASESGTKALLMVEGEACVEAARQLGLAAITMSSNAWALEGLKVLAGSLLQHDLSIIYYPDFDAAGGAKAEKVLDTLTQYGVYCQILNPLAIWKDCPPKGDIVNAIAAGVDVIAEIEKAICAITQDKPVETAQAELPPAPETQTFKSKSNKKQIFNNLRNRYGDRLRLNIMSKQVELDGKALKPDYLYLQLLDEDIDCRKEFASDIFYFLAQQNQYHPVQDYLEKVYRQHNATGILDNAAQRYLGTNNPLHNIFVRKFAIAAVARVFKPGCKVDTALILQGGQGYGKSTFYKVLAGEYFDDSLSNATTDKDEKLKLHATWLMEWAELESIFSRKDVSSVKAFLSSATDKLRPPFARVTENYPRHSVIVGSTNIDDFLLDATGSRRFWVVPVEKINIAALQNDRDRFWSDAVARYRAGEQWWLTNEEQHQANDINRNYQRDDTWTDPIRNYCEMETSVTIKQVLEHLGIEIAKQDRSCQIRVADTLRQLGYEKEHTKKGKVWKKESNKGHRVTDQSEQGFQSDPYSDPYKSMSHQDDLPIIDSDPSRIDESLNGQGLWVTTESLDLQGVQPTVTHVTQNFNKNQENLESENQCQISVDKPTPGPEHPFKIGDRVEDLEKNRHGNILEFVVRQPDCYAIVDFGHYKETIWIEYLKPVTEPQLDKHLSISFGKTLPELLSGTKTETRRLWKDRHAKKFTQYYENQKLIKALNKDARASGSECVGHLELTVKPYKEKLADMPECALAAEGFPNLSKAEFINQFFDGDDQQEVWVIKFEFEGIKNA